jgi:hypothetical protein
MITHIMVNRNLSAPQFQSLMPIINRMTGSVQVQVQVLNMTVHDYCQLYPSTFGRIQLDIARIGYCTAISTIDNFPVILSITYYN